MALQTAIRKKLEDAKSERDRSQASDDVRALKEQITELKCAPYPEGSHKYTKTVCYRGNPCCRGAPIESCILWQVRGVPWVPRFL